MGDTHHGASTCPLLGPIQNVVRLGRMRTRVLEKMSPQIGELLPRGVIALHQRRKLATRIDGGPAVRVLHRRRSAGDPVVRDVLDKDLSHQPAGLRCGIWPSPVHALSKPVSYTHLTLPTSDLV